MQGIIITLSVKSDTKTILFNKESQGFLDYSFDEGDLPRIWAMPVNSNRPSASCKNALQIKPTIIDSQNINEPLYLSTRTIGGTLTEEQLESLL